MWNSIRTAVRCPSSLGQLWASTRLKPSETHCARDQKILTPFPEVCNLVHKVWEIEHCIYNIVLHVASWIGILKPRRPKMKSSQMAHLDVHRFTVFDDVAILHQGRGQVRHAVVTRHTTGDIPSVDHKPWKLRDRGCHWISNVGGSPTKSEDELQFFPETMATCGPICITCKFVICEMCYQWSGAQPADSTPRNWTSSSRALFIIVFLQGRTKQPLATRPMRGSHDRHSLLDTNFVGIPPTTTKSGPRNDRCDFREAAGHQSTNLFWLVQIQDWVVQPTENHWFPEEACI